jgi:hypothetical protein
MMLAAENEIFRREEVMRSKTNAIAIIVAAVALLVSCQKSITASTTATPAMPPVDTVPTGETPSPNITPTFLL